MPCFEKRIQLGQVAGFVLSKGIQCSPCKNIESGAHQPRMTTRRRSERTHMPLPEKRQHERWVGSGLFREGKEGMRSSLHPLEICEVKSSSNLDERGEPTRE
jgi:hypothetical protein